MIPKSGNRFSEKIILKQQMATWRPGDAFDSSLARKQAVPFQELDHQAVE
jgi:hypothetical protein